MLLKRTILIFFANKNIPYQCLLILFYDMCISVDGHWGSWSTTSCSVTCGSGTKYRNRICNNPSPSDGGKHCVGKDTELSQCRLRHCPGTCYFQFRRK